MDETNSQRSHLGAPADFIGFHMTSASQVPPCYPQPNPTPAGTQGQNREPAQASATARVQDANLHPPSWPPLPRKCSELALWLCIRVPLAQPALPASAAVCMHRGTESMRTARPPQLLVSRDQALSSLTGLHQHTHLQLAPLNVHLHTAPPHTYLHHKLPLQCECGGKECIAIEEHTSGQGPCSCQ